MSAAGVLRATSVVALVQWAAHMTLFLRAKPTHGAEEVAVVQAMRSHRFRFVGAVRSYWDMYFGYGLMAALVVLIEAVMLWQLAGAPLAALPLVRGIAIVLLVYNVGHAILAGRYFFITPVVPDVIIAGGLAVAIAMM